MLQFSAEHMAAIRAKATSAHIDQIIEDNHVVLNSDVLVPPDNRATWNLYYFCPEHGVRLQWERHKPTEHQCPVDQQIFRGEPYDGAWWRWLNGLNAKACKELGLLWQLTGESRYLTKVSEILLQYANYYPDYEEHGGIPYNGPGKANAQTLCEANCNLDFALGYDFIRDELSDAQQQYIEQRLLREGAEFLMAHRSNQLHNHEVKISATIGVIGLLLNDKGYLNFALHTDYGLHYQLKHGIQGDGLWFEGSIHYHYYALQALLAFEKLACNTPYSVARNPNYRAMVSFPLQLLLNNGEFPKLNDCIAGQEQLTHTHLFEFAYAQLGDDILGSALVSIYQQQPRDNIDALLYGVAELPNLPPLGARSLHAPNSGITLFNHGQTNNALLLKHAPFGGEHDHYDRLGLIILMNGQEVLPDLGTTGYGAELHYGYYKNTATHNTLAVNQQNQSPINPKLLNYQKFKDFCWIDTVADWCEPEAKVDSHTIKAWDNDSYRDVQFRRSILWLGDAAIEINQISNPHQQQLDLCWHVRGDLTESSLPLRDSDNPLQGPLARMHSCQQTKLDWQPIELTFATATPAAYQQTHHSDNGQQLLVGKAPDNPATQDLQYLLARSQTEQFNHLVLHDLGGGWRLQSAKWQANRLLLGLAKSQRPLEVIINFNTSSVQLSWD